MRLLGKEVVLYTEPGPLDERVVTWQGSDLWKLIGSYFGYAILAGILLMIIGFGERLDQLSAIGDGLVLGALFYSHSRHHFWPSAAYWRVTLSDFRQYWKQGVLWGIGAQIGGTLIRIVCALVASAFGSSLSGVESNNPVWGISFGPTWILLAISVVVLAPLMEELFMRGMLYGRLRQRYGVRTGLLLSSLIFAAVHLSLFGFISFLFVGLILGLLYERTGSLAPSMIAHATGNLISVGLALLMA